MAEYKYGAFKYIGKTLKEYIKEEKLTAIQGSKLQLPPKVYTYILQQMPSHFKSDKQFANSIVKGLKPGVINGVRKGQKGVVILSIDSVVKETPFSFELAYDTNWGTWEIIKVETLESSFGLLTSRPPLWKKTWFITALLGLLITVPIVLYTKYPTFTSMLSWDDQGAADVIDAGEQEQPPSGTDREEDSTHAPEETPAEEHEQEKQDKNDESVIELSEEELAKMLEEEREKGRQEAISAIDADPEQEEEPAEQPISFYVSYGMSSDEVAWELYKLGVFDDPSLLNREFIKRGLSRKLQIRNYYFYKDMDLEEVLQKFK